MRTKSGLMIGAAAVTSALLAVAGCGGSNSGSNSASSNAGTGSTSGQTTSTTLTLASTTPPTTLNPTLSGNGDPLEFFLELSYDSLIRLMPNGTYAPDLATSWGYVGSSNTVFDMTLRKGVKFSDGQALTPAVVKQFLLYYAKSGEFASRFDFKSISVTGPLSLQIVLAQPDPELPYYFEQDLVSGDVIGPAGLANPTTLGTSTDGAGPYVLDSSATVTGTKYVYVPNKYYWNPSAIHWKQVIIDVISDPTATLDALQTGQVQVAMGQTTSAQAAKAAGLSVFAVPYTWDSVFLMDRSGTSVKALGSPLVRQALNYAVDRSAVTQALFGSYGQADDETAVPGYEGYNSADANLYPYNPAKAKALLAQAGYPNGFTLPLLAFNLQPGEITLAQAVASYWSNIGVNVQITTPSTGTEYGADLESHKFGAMVFEYGAQPIYVDAGEIAMPTGPLNPYGSNSPAMDAAESQIASATTAASQESASDLLETEMLNAAWFAPIAANDETFYVSHSIGGFTLQPLEVSPDPVDWYPVH
jgi:ABC-type transport system substrate-binding protein